MLFVTAITSVVAMRGITLLKLKQFQEGVETLDTVEFLKIISCNMIQGACLCTPDAKMSLKTNGLQGVSDYDNFSSDYDKVSEIIPR